MTEIIELTEDRLNDLMFCLLSKHECNCGYEPNDEDVKEFREVIKQILDDHEKARKVDDMYIRVGQLIQENKQLKEKNHDLQHFYKLYKQDSLELTNLKEAYEQLVKSYNELDLGHEETWLHYDDLKEELRRYQVLQWVPKELEIELNKGIINRQKLEEIKELVDNESEEGVCDYNGGVTMYLKIKKILDSQEKK